MMNKLRAAFTTRNIILGLLVGCSVGLFGMGAGAVYAVKIQPDPQVIRKLEPQTNTGRDVNGLTLDQWIASGKRAEDYKPVLKSRFRHGETMYTLRQDCFVNKTAGYVYRAFYGGDRRDKNGDLDVTKQSGTQYVLDTMPIPSRSDGCPVKNHRTEIKADMPPQVWTYVAGADFYKNPMQPYYRINFRPVVIEVVP